eukprot:m.48568 g.48568  ORF g.48568 m.48568 type:complete len:315 (+) comp6431_c0_seq4:58-1002(+)
MRRTRAQQTLAQLEEQDGTLAFRFRATHQLMPTLATVRARLPQAGALAAFAMLAELALHSLHSSVWEGHTPQRMALGVSLLWTLALYSYVMLCTHTSESSPETMSGDMRICATCHLARFPRTGHCRICGVCIRKRLHHCAMTNTCIGEDTLAHFARFLLYSAASCFLVVYISFPVVYHSAVSNPDRLHDLVVLILPFVNLAKFFATPWYLIYASLAVRILLLLGIAATLLLVLVLRLIASDRSWEEWWRGAPSSGSVPQNFDKVFGSWGLWTWWLPLAGGASANPVECFSLPTLGTPAQNHPLPCHAVWRHIEL